MYHSDKRQAQNTNSHISIASPPIWACFVKLMSNVLWFNAAWEAFVVSAHHKQSTVFWSRKYTAQTQAPALTALHLIIVF